MGGAAGVADRPSHRARSVIFFRDFLALTRRMTSDEGLFRSGGSIRHDFWY